MHIVLVGPPGAGKGTQARAVTAELGIPHVSTGDIFRANVRGGTPLGQEAEAYMSRGELVPDDVVNRMVADRLDQPDAAHGALLDGYPRTVAQAEALDKVLADRGEAVDLVLHFVVDDAELEARIAKRQSEERRSDDDHATFLRRLREYEAQTVDLIPHYRERGLLRDVDALGTIDAVRERVMAQLRDIPRPGDAAETVGRTGPYAAGAGSGDAFGTPTT